MRFLLFGLIFSYAITVRAAGFAYGKSFSVLQETEQTAVIHLEPGMAAVDLFITVAGIPNGETATYVLPFWYPPDDFHVESMTAETFRTRYVQPAFDRLSRDNQLAYGEVKPAMQDSLAGASALFLGLASPYIFEHLLGSTWRDPNLCAQRDMQSYFRSRTTSAAVRVDHVGPMAIPMLAATSGMPALFAQALSRYQAPYAAVMRLTGTGQDDWVLHEYGMHFHFRHRLRKDPHAYTYPLRTGAAWAQPGMLTEIYAVCPSGYVLKMANPTDGLSINYPWFNKAVNDLPSSPPDRTLAEINSFFAREHRELVTELPSLRASQLNRDCTRPSTRHVAYFNTNIGGDVYFRLATRSHPWRARLASALLKPGTNNQAALWTAALAWLIAIALVLVPWWWRERDRSRVGHILVAFFWPMGMLTVGEVAGILFWWPGIIIFGLVLYLVARKKVAQPAKYLLHPRLLTWLLATGLYILFSAGWLLLASWAEGAVR